MSKPKHSPELKQSALVLAAGGSASTAARQLGLPDSTVQHWVVQAERSDPGTIARYKAAKRALGEQNVLEKLDESTKRIMAAILSVPLDTAKDVQAGATALGIMDDHFGGRQPPGGGTRFGTSNLLDGWTERDRVTLERIERTERLTLERDVPEVQDPVRGTGT